MKPRSNNALAHPVATENSTPNVMVMQSCRYRKLAGGKKLNSVSLLFQENSLIC